MKKLNSCDGIYNNSIDVRFTKYCDNNCSFCIEKTGCKNLGMNVDNMIKSTIKKLQEEKDTVLILGGEPLLYLEEVLKYIKAIRNHAKKIYLTTSLPITILKNYPVFLEIISILDGLNVSIQHYENDINNNILQATSKHNRLLLLKKICYVESNSKKIRVSINLVKGYIDNQMELDKCLSLFQKINVKHVKINELQHCEDLYVSFCNITNNKMDNPFTHGCQKDIKYKDYKMKITLKRSCFLVEKSQKANISCLVKCIKMKKTKNSMCVIYENGQCENGWVVDRKGV